MDLKPNHNSPILSDPAPITKSRLGVHSNMLPYSAAPGVGFAPNLLLITRKRTGVLDDVRASIWLDAMKSSSPPPNRIAKDVVNELPSFDPDLLYCSWMVLFLLLSCSDVGQVLLILDELFMYNMLLCYFQVKYPSALASFDQIVTQAKGKRIALFLDYDGTLSPIVDNPDCAFMSDAVRICSSL